MSPLQGNLLLVLIGFCRKILNVEFICASLQAREGCSCECKAHSGVLKIKFRMALV